MFIKMKCFEQNDPTGRFRNWMEEEHMKYEDSSQSPFVEFIQTDPPSEESKAHKKKRRKKKATKHTSTDLNGMFEDL